MITEKKVRSQKTLAYQEAKATRMNLDVHGKLEYRSHKKLKGVFTIELKVQIRPWMVFNRIKANPLPTLYLPWAGRGVPLLFHDCERNSRKHTIVSIFTLKS